MWQKFLDDYSRFEDWLKTSERKAALPNSAGVLYTVAKEELKKFEVSDFLLSQSSLYGLKFVIVFKYEENESEGKHILCTVEKKKRSK